MTNKIKYILIFIFTIIMAISVKFGAVNESYYQDLEVEKYCNKIDKVILNVESMALKEGIKDEELQEEINNSRLIVEEASIYLSSKSNVKLEDIVPRWSERLDSIQQLILIHIEEKLELNKNSNNGYENVELKGIIPQNIPMQWKEYYKEKFSIDL